METWFFTFGLGQGMLAHKYVKLHGDREGARQKMIEAFGGNWCYQYSEAEFAPMLPMYTELALEGK